MPLIWDTRDAEYVKPGEALTEVPTGFWENLLAADEAFTLSSQTSSEKANLAGAYDPIIEALNADAGRNALTGQATDRSAFANPYGRTANDPLNGPDWRARYQPEDLEDRIWRTIQERRAADPEALPDLPADREALRARITEQVQTAEQNAAEVRARADTWGAIGAFTGGMTGALKDPASIATLPMGLPVARGIIGTALAEGAIGGGVTALTLPDTNRYRQEQGLDPEDPATAILFGTAGGAVFGGGARAIGRVVEGMADGRGISGGLQDVGRDLSPAANWQSAKDMLRQFRATVKTPTPEQRGAAAVLERQAYIEETSPGTGDLTTEDLHARSLDETAEALAQGRGDHVPALVKHQRETIERFIASMQPDRRGRQTPDGVWHGRLMDARADAISAVVQAELDRKIDLRNATHRLDEDGIRHALARHGADALPLEPRHLARVPEVVREGEVMTASTSDAGVPTIVYRKMVDGDWLYVVEEIQGKKQPARTLTFKTAYRNPGPKRKPGAEAPGSYSERYASPDAPDSKPFTVYTDKEKVAPRTPPRKPLPPSLRPPAGARPKSLGTWLAREGGIDDSAVDYQGWLRRMEAHRRRPGLVNTQAGMPLDDAALRAWEAGYFPGATERPTINDLLDALDEDLRGGPGRYADGDMEAAAAWTEWEAKLAELDALGIDPAGMTDAQLDAAITAAVGREAWERAAPGIPISDDEARAIVAEARASGRDVEDVASDAAEARAAIFEAAGIRADDDIPFDAEGDPARLEAIGDDAAERWRRAEQAGLENPEFDVAWLETGTDEKGRPQYDFRSADDAFALLDEEDAVVAQVSVCVGRGA